MSLVFPTASFAGAVDVPLSDATLLDFTQTGAGGTTLATDAVNATANSLLIFFASYRFSSARTFSTPTDTLDGTQTWTAITGSELHFDNGTTFLGIAGWWALAGSAPGTSKTVSMNLTGSATVLGVELFEIVVGYHASPIGAVDTTGQTSGTSLAFALSPDPAASSVGLATFWGHLGSGSVTPPTGFSELYENPSTSTTVRAAAMRNGSVQNNPSFTGLNSGLHIGLAVEIKKA